MVSFNLPIQNAISTEHEIMTEKCSDTCQHKIKLYSDIAKNDLTLVEIHATV